MLSVCILAAIIPLLACSVYLVSAHADLIRSEPAVVAVLAKAPAEMVMEFSEDLDPSFSAAQLADANGRIIAPGPGNFDKAARRVLRLPLPALPDGVYSAAWKARSAIDGHVDDGTVSFTISQGGPSTSDLLATIPVQDAPDIAATLPTAREVLFRWLNYIAVALVTGSFAFVVLVWRPAYRLKNTEAFDAADVRISANLKTVAVVGLVALLVFGIADAVVRVGLAVGQPISTSGKAYADFFAGRIGQIFLVRWALAVVIGVLALRAPRAGAESARLWLLGWAACAGVLATFSLQSHSAGRPGHVVFDWLHINAMSIWLGGLIPLAIVLMEARRQKDVPLKWLIRRFSIVLVLCVSVLAATGLYNAAELVGSLDGLTQTTFGRALMVKLSLFAILFALGGLNLLLISPRIEHGQDSWARWLGRSARTEMLIGSGLLLMVSILTSSAPAADVRAAQQAAGLHSAQVSGVGIRLWVVPALPGNNAFAVDVTDGRRNATLAPATVALRITKIGSNGVADSSSITQIETTSTDGKRFTATGSYLPAAGHWLMQVTVRKAGFNDVSSSFTLAIGQP